MKWFLFINLELTNSVMEYVDHDDFLDPDNLNEYDPESQFSRVLLFSDEEWKKYWERETTFSLSLL